MLEAWNSRLWTNWHAIGTPRDAPPLRGHPDASAARLCHSVGVGRTVLIVDDHAGFRSAARAFLEAAGFDVVGEAGDGRSAVDAVTWLGPDVVLLDVKLPDIDGFAVAAELPRTGPRIVFVSSRSIASYRGRLAANPAWSFIPKSDLTVEALSAAVG